MTAKAGEPGYWVLEAPRQLRWRLQSPTPLDAGFARVRFLACCICGSDISKFEGRRPDLGYPYALGHEFTAEVIEVGAGVDRVRPGDFVTSDLNYRCGGCDQCREGRSHLCREAHRGAFSNRAFANFGDIEASYLLVLGGSGRQLALIEPLSCVLHAVQWAAPRRDERVLVVGAGGLGSCLAFAMGHGAEPIELEIAELSTERRKRIAAAIEPNGRAIVEPRGEYDVVIDVSGTVSGLRAACTHARPGGRICTLSHLDGQSTDFLLPALSRRDISFKVSYVNGEVATMEVAATMLAEGWHGAWDDLIGVVPLEQLQSAFEQRRGSPWPQTLVEVATPSR